MAYPTRLWGTLAALIFAVSTGAHAEGTTTGSLTGTLSDASGGVLPGATVTLSGPNIQGTRTETTDAQGTYRFRNLPGPRLQDCRLAERIPRGHPGQRTGAARAGRLGQPDALAGRSDRAGRGHRGHAARRRIQHHQRREHHREPVRDPPVGARVPAVDRHRSRRRARHGITIAVFRTAPPSVRRRRPRTTTSSTDSRSGIRATGHPART